jgi:hypothetical protein
MITKEELDDIRLMYDSGHPLVMKLVEEVEKANKLVQLYKQAGNKMEDFIATWEDCLSGVQMSDYDFESDCGLGEWRLLALKEEGENQ